MNRYVLFIASVWLALVAGCGESKSPVTPDAAPEPAQASAGSARRVTIDADAARAAGIEVSSAGPAALKESLTLYGVVQANAERTRNVAARFPGIVKSVAKNLGDTVRAGAVLATVESNDSLQTYPLQAPQAGTITARNVNAGEAVAEQVLFTITDLDTVWVDLALFARDMAQVRVGQEVSVRAVDGGPEGKGRVTWLSALGSAATQSRSARVPLNNDERLWTPGLYVVGAVTLAERPVALAVRSSALQTLDGKTVVFSARGNTYEARPVTPGASDGAFTEIIDGLAPGASYVSAGSFVIKADIEKSSAEHEH